MLLHFGTEDNMERQRVISSNVRSIGYDSASSTLEVEFINDGLYQYFNVPGAVYAAFMRAPSKGSYLANHIKDRYRFRRLR